MREILEMLAGLEGSLDGESARFCIRHALAVSDVRLQAHA